MSRIAPEGPVYQAGTLSGNPLAVAAGLATLRKLDAARCTNGSRRLGQRLEAGRRRGASPAPARAAHVAAAGLGLHPLLHRASR